MLTFLSIVFAILVMVAIFFFLVGVMNSAWEPMAISTPLIIIAAIIAYVCYVLQGGI